MIAGVTLESATGAIRTATGDDNAVVKCITLRPHNISIAGRLGDNRYVYGEGPTMLDAYVDFIARARRLAENPATT